MVAKTKIGLGKTLKGIAQLQIKRVRSVRIEIA
jgi:hypothetical protein